MTAFSVQEVIFSALFSFVYGGIYAVFLSILTVILNLVHSLKTFKISIFSYDNIFKFKERIIAKNQNFESGILLFFEILLFSLGIILTSYVALDGVIRLYVLIIASASIFLFKITFSPLFLAFSSFVLEVFCRIFCIFMRFSLYPILKFYHKKCNKI